MEDESEQLSRRDRLMRHLAARMTPEERIARGRQMHEWAMRQLESNPEAYNRFIRRNMSQRAISPHENP